MTYLFAIALLAILVLLVATDPLGRLREAYRRHRGVRRFVNRLPLRIAVLAVSPVGGAAGELTIKDWTAQNKANNNLQPYTCVDIDTANSTAKDTAVVPPAGALAECIGIVYDKSRLDPTGAVIKNSGVTIRTYGFARVVAAGAIAVGAYVSVANASGQVQSQAQAGAGVQPKAIVGRALTSAAALNDRPVIALMIGARY